MRTLTAIALLSATLGTAQAFDVDGYRSGMTASAVVSKFNGRDLRTSLTDAAKDIVYYTIDSYSFGFCRGRLFSYSQQIEGGVFAQKFSETSKILGKPIADIAQGGPSTNAFYFSWPQHEDNLVLSLIMVEGENVQIHYGSLVSDNHICEK